MSRPGGGASPGGSLPRPRGLEGEVEPDRVPLATYARLASLFRDLRRAFLGNLGIAAVSTLSMLLGPHLVRGSIDALKGTEAVALTGALAFCVVYLVNRLAGWGLTVWNVRATVTLGQTCLHRLRLRIFDRIQALSMAFFDRTKEGWILSRADNDLFAMEHTLTWGAGNLLTSVLTLAGALAMLVRYHPNLTLAVSAVLPILCLATEAFRRRGSYAHRLLHESLSRITAVLAENIQGALVVQAFVREDRNLGRFSEMNDQHLALARRQSRVWGSYSAGLHALSGAGTAIILAYGGHLLLSGEIRLGDLSAFLFYLAMFFGPIHMMSEIYNEALATGVAADRIFRLLDQRPEVADAEGALPLPAVRGEVRFDGVAFRYRKSGGPWILQGLNLRIAAGEAVALVGPTGAGKTTLASLLARFYDPDEGAVRVDGFDLRAVTIGSLRSQVGIVLQDNFLFTGTVLDNLRYGRPEATEEQVRAAARALGLESRLQALPAGYATRVEERGRNLSAGERQMVCFVRALLADPRILILDEATSQLDFETEAALQEALFRLLRGRTALLIAHRLTTVARVDRIVVMQEGRIVEDGPPADLKRRGGPFAHMVREFAAEGSPAV